MYVLKNIGLHVRQLAKVILRRSHSGNMSYAETSLATEFSLSHYDVIGFDLDHTICKYKLPALYELIYDSMAQFFVEKHNYPKSLLTKQPHDTHYAQKGLIFDKARGNLLKLDQDHRIINALHGTRVMSADEIKQVYGLKHTWMETGNVPVALCGNAPLELPYHAFKDYFGIIGSALCAKVVDALDSKNGGQLSSYNIWPMFIDSLIYMYERKNFKDDTGNFFPTLKKNPHMYLEKCSSVTKNWLRNLHESKKTFLLTGSNYDSAVFLAEYCLGSDWADYFDVIVTFGRKPRFFSGTNPFYAVEGDLEAYRISPDKMKPHTIYSQGNWSDFQNLCSNICDVKLPKALYVGDSLIEDVFAPSHFAGCDTIAIVEEMLCGGRDKHFLDSDIWGSFFTSKTNNLTLWARLLAEYAKLAVPNLDALTVLDINDKVCSFSPSEPYSGYFPELPCDFKN